MIVVDASAVIEILLRTRLAPRIEARLLSGGEALHAPSHIDLEITQVLRRFVRVGDRSAEDAAAALEDWRDIPITLHSPRRLLDDVWSHRDQMSAYDAAYVSLAVLLGATLVTSDGRLARAAAPFAEIDLYAP